MFDVATGQFVPESAVLREAALLNISLQLFQAAGMCLCFQICAVNYFHGLTL